MNKPITILIGLQFLVIIILLYLFTNHPLVVDVPINNHHYHTDTIWLSETFTDEVIPKLEEIIKSGKVAPASEITIYTPEYITTTIEITPDSILLLVDELRDSLEIAKN